MGKSMRCGSLMAKLMSVLKLDELSKSPAMLTSDVAYQILSKTIDPEVAASKETRHKALRGKVDLDDPASSFAALSV